MEKLQQVNKQIINLVSELLSVMDFDAEVEEKYENEISRINIISPEAGFLIGQNGGNLLSLEHLLKAMVFKKMGQAVSFVLDVNDYKKSRIEFLEQLIKEAADEVVLSRQPYFFQPMSSFERRIIHQLITDQYPTISSQSEGERDFRRVVIRPK